MRVEDRAYRLQLTDVIVTERGWNEGELLA